MRQLISQFKWKRLYAESAMEQLKGQVIPVEKLLIKLRALAPKGNNGDGWCSGLEETVLPRIGIVFKPLEGEWCRECDECHLYWWDKEDMSDRLLPHADLPKTVSAANALLVLIAWRNEFSKPAFISFVSWIKKNAIDA